jgi:hypothetical protein
MSWQLKERNNSFSDDEIVETWLESNRFYWFRNCDSFLYNSEEIAKKLATDWMKTRSYTDVDIFGTKRLLLKDSWDKFIELYEEDKNDT